MEINIDVDVTDGLLNALQEYLNQDTLRFEAKCDLGQAFEAAVRKAICYPDHPVTRSNVFKGE